MSTIGKEVSEYLTKRLQTLQLSEAKSCDTLLELESTMDVYLTQKLKKCIPADSEEKDLNILKMVCDGEKCSLVPASGCSNPECKCSPCLCENCTCGGDGVEIEKPAEVVEVQPVKECKCENCACENCTCGIEKPAEPVIAEQPVEIPAAVEPVKEEAQQPAEIVPPEPVIAEPVAEPVIEPVAEPVIEPVAEPVIEPVAEPVKEEVQQPVEIPAVVEQPAQPQLSLHNPLLNLSL